MKNKFKELVLPIGAVALAALPFVNVVSCSSNNPKNEIKPGSDKIHGISDSTIKEFESNLVEKKIDIYWVSMLKQIPKKYDKFLDLIKNSKNLESKSIEEVQQLSNEIFDNLNEKDLEKIIKNALVFGNQKQKNKSVISTDLSFFKESIEAELYLTTIQEIENFSFDKNNKTVSFTLKASEKYEEMWTKYNNSYNFSRVMTFRYENIKIEPSYYEINNYEMNNNILLPIIKFSNIQDKNPSVTFLKNESKGIFDMNNFKKMQETYYDLIDPKKYEEKTGEKLPSKEEMLRDLSHSQSTEFDFLCHIWSIEYLEKNGEKLGVVDGEFRTSFQSFAEIYNEEIATVYLINNSGLDYSREFNDNGEFVGKEYDKPKTSPIEYLPIFMSNPNSIDDVWYVFQKK